jgi:hypothetical protein
VTGDVVVVIDTVGELTVVPAAVCVRVVTGVVVETGVPVVTGFVPTGDVVTGVPVVVLSIISVGVPVVVFRGASDVVPVRVSLPVTAMVPVTLTVPGELSFDEGGTVCVQPAMRRKSARITKIIAMKEIRSISSQPKHL